MATHARGLLGVPTDNVLVLETEQDAWAFLEKVQNRNYQFPEDIILGNWCNLKIYLQGEKWHSSVTPSIFPVFNEFQKLIYHAFAEAKYNDKKKRLTKEEKDGLEIIINVSPGSSKTRTEVDVNKIAKACINKMTGKEILVGVTILALAWASPTVINSYFQNKRDIRLIESNSEDKKALLQSFQFMSEEETKRMEILTRAMSTNQIAQGVIEDSEAMHKEMLKSATKAEKSQINGVKLNKEVADELIKTGKDSPEPKQINGTFEVLSLDWSTPHHITLRRLDDGVIVKAEFDLQWLSKDSKEIIKNTEWKEDGKKHLNAKINARISKGRIVNAELVSVELEK